MSGPEDNPADEHQPTEEEWDTAMGTEDDVDVTFRASLAEPERLIREAIICVINTPDVAHVANIGKAIWRLLDAAGQLAEICPKEIYDPTQPTGMGFALKVRSGESLEAEDVVDELRRLIAPLRTFMRFYGKISPITACEEEVSRLEEILSEIGEAESP